MDRDSIRQRYSVYRLVEGKNLMAKKNAILQNLYFCYLDIHFDGGLIQIGSTWLCMLGRGHPFYFLRGNLTHHQQFLIREHVFYARSNLELLHIL